MSVVRIEHCLEVLKDGPGTSYELAPRLHAKFPDVYGVLPEDKTEAFWMTYGEMGQIEDLLLILESKVERSERAHPTRDSVRGSGRVFRLREEK